MCKDPKSDNWLILYVGAIQKISSKIVTNIFFKKVKHMKIEKLAQLRNTFSYC